MPEPAHFSPEQLDRIEDALETLEGDFALEDPTPEVQGVLASYREILQQSRHAMPLAEPPPGVLAAVFAEARAVAAEPSATVAPEPVAAKPSFFARFRRSFLIPSLALAGTAALVLWISRPQDGSVTLDGAVAVEAQGPAGASTPTPSAEPAAAEDKQEAIAAPADEAQAQQASERVTEQEEALNGAPEPPPPPVAATAKVAPGSTAPAVRVTGQLTELDDADAPDTRLEKERSRDAWGRLERADRARESGDCAAAHSDYMIATEDDIPGVRARAYAGLGLCNLQNGDDAGSEDAFQRARGIDPAIDKFIAAEREPSGAYRPASKSKRRSKTKKSPRPATKHKADVPDAVDNAAPFMP